MPIRLAVALISVGVAIWLAAGYIVTHFIAKYWWKEQSPMAYEDQVNNSHMIKKEFNQSNPKYFSPLPRKTQRCVHYHGRSGKTKVFTEEEKFLYRIKMIGNEVEFEV